MTDLHNSPRGSATVAARMDRLPIIRQHRLATVAMHPQGEVLATLDSAGVPSGAIYDAEDITKDPQYAARDMLIPAQVEVGSGVSREVRFPGIVPKLSEHPGQMRWPGPDLGEHTRPVLQRLLDLSDSTLDQLAQEGMI